jgi:ATP-dependent RNA helicase SUPV3L1/SUV3
MEKPGGMSANDGLSVYEENYHICDLLFNFSEKFELGVFSSDIMQRKREISDAITAILVEQNLRPRNCRKCGKTIAWNYRFGVCQECFDRLRHAGVSPGGKKRRHRR